MKPDFLTGEAPGVGAGAAKARFKGKGKAKGKFGGQGRFASSDSDLFASSAFYFEEQQFGGDIIGGIYIGLQGETDSFEYGTSNTIGGGGLDGANFFAFRRFSIFDGNRGSFDSGDGFEQVTALEFGSFG
jgi:hypothetical protein